MVRRRRVTRSQARLDGAEGAEDASRSKFFLRRANWAKVLALLLLLVNAWFMYQFLSSPRFWVREVHVEGGEVVSGDDVRDVADVLDESIFNIRVSELKDRIEERFGCIKDASVHCELPCRVVITLEERQDILVWSSEEKRWWVDKDGNVLGPTDDAREHIVVRDVRAWRPSPQDHLAGVPLDLAWDVTEVVPAARSYDYVPNVGLVLYVTDHRWPVYLGYQGDAAFKVAVMRKLVQRLLENDTEVEYIDLRNERRPSYGKL